MALDKIKDILALQDVPAAIEFHVPEWNDTVFLKSPSANDGVIDDCDFDMSIVLGRAATLS